MQEKMLAYKMRSLYSSWFTKPIDCNAGNGKAT